MNSFSNLGAFVSPILMGWILQVSHHWTTVLTLAGSSTALAAILWLGVNPRERHRPDPLTEASEK
jgi:cyanate permease